MVLYGYDAATFNAISGSKNWDAYFNDIVRQFFNSCFNLFLPIWQVSNHKHANLYAAINTAYTVGAIVAGWFFGGPLADFAGRRAGMIAGSALVIIATFMQCFSPKGKIGVFIAGRVVIGLGQGLALSMFTIFHLVTSC